MKQFLTATITHAIGYGLLLTLAYSVFIDSSSLVRVTAAAYWVIMALALFIGPLYYLLSYAAKNSKDPEARKKALDLISDTVKKKNAFRRALGWVELVITSVLLAYAGWVFTSVFFVLSSLWLRLFVSMARDTIAKIIQPQVSSHEA
ncbi:hypothetical protein ACVQMG_000514 [Enterobacter roggenkampii]